MKFKLIFLSIIVGSLTSVLGQRRTFDHDFAPADAFVKPQERPYRDDFCLNGSWKFYPVDKAESLSKEKIINPSVPINPEWDGTNIKIPSPWNVNSFAHGDGGDFITYPSYPVKWESVKAGWLMRKFPFRKEWKNKRIFLHFEAVDGYTQVFVNKQKVGENFDLFLPFEIDITDKVQDNSDNELLVWVADAKLFDQPGKYGRRTYVGGSFWGQMKTGIWQDVYLLAKPPLNIKNTFVKPTVDKDELEIETQITNGSSKEEKINISGSVMPWINLSDNAVLNAPVPHWKLGEKVLDVNSVEIAIGPGETKTINFKLKVNRKLNTWTPESPNLYGLVLRISKGTQVVDQAYTRFGWRQVTIHDGKVYLNGTEIHLKGDSWHFMGIPQMTRRYAWAWYTMLKQCGANAVRLHAQPYPSFYLDMADEMGMLVLDESGIWASDTGPKLDSEDYWKSCDDHLKRLIIRDRNHPSVFGWSVCNENIPIVENVLHAPDSIKQKQLSEINNWIDIAQKLDPSRMWISGDGETDLPTNLPTVIGHYGDENSYHIWSSKGKAWGVGECGMAYYGTPHQTSVYNGNRSYESQQGRMEAIAIEAYQLLALQKKYNASYSSVFNIVWYGLKPLELGLVDTTKAPTLSDGVYFGTYKEDYPGVQPERLGPYTTTLNPGYDQTLPLYEPWPLFYAIKDAFSGINSDAYKEKKSREVEIIKPDQNKSPVSVVLLSSDKDSVLFKTLIDAGLEVSTKTDINKQAKVLFIIDGKYPKDDPQSHLLEKNILSKGGNVIIIGIRPETLDAVNKFLPEPVLLDSRDAFSFITNYSDDIIKGLGNEDLYFTELSRKPVMHYGLIGDFAKNGKIILEACNADWKRWNYNAEYLKTAAIVRSEREKKASGNALVVHKYEKGNVYLFSLDPDVLFKVASPKINQIFSNLGAVIKTPDPKNTRALNTEGMLENSAVVGTFSIMGKSFTEAANIDFLNDTKEDAFLPGNIINGHSVKLGKASDGVLNLRTLNMEGPTENAVAYLSFWIYSPRSLVNLLAEPDIPRLDMLIGVDDGYQIYLNQKLISESLKKQGLEKKGKTISALPLEKGWNHFLIKFIQFGGDWRVAIEFKSNSEKYMQEIKSKISQ